MRWFNIFCACVAVVALIVLGLCIIASIWSLPTTDLNAKIALTAIIVVVFFGALSAAPI